MKKPKLLKCILAWMGIILLAGLYLATFILSLMKSPTAQTLFTISLWCTVIVPILGYAILLIYRVLNRKD